MNRNKFLVHSRTGLANCRRLVARKFEIEIDYLTTKELQKKEKGENLSDEEAERLIAARIGAEKYRREESRLRFASKIFGDDVRITPSEKNQPQCSEIPVLLEGEYLS